MSRYEDVLGLRHHLNGYAYQSLSKAESALFDRYYDAQGEEHREFCQLFGSDKIVEHLGGFLGYFMIRLPAAGTQTPVSAVLRSGDVDPNQLPPPEGAV